MRIMKYLTEKQINNYNKNGFVLIRKVLSNSMCDFYKKILIKEIKKGEKIYQKSKNKKTIINNRNTIADIPRRISDGYIQDIAHRNSKIMQLAKNAKLINLANQIFGKNINAYRLYRSLSVFKTKNILSKSIWHQDMPYWKGTANKVTAWISLNKVTKQSGSLCFISGSHKNKDIYNKYNEKQSLLVTQNVDESKRVTVGTEIGDIILIHPLTIHASEENILRKNRYALIFTYQPASDTSHHRSGPAELIQKSKRTENYFV